MRREDAPPKWNLGIATLGPLLLLHDPGECELPLHA
ncbi:uncharacterized protein METZ01_LOCUS1154 [marine metagenome]|uniref:Uncharacterized protein n=1 Tax=marine metagenome TaxID=408172 RepID=A0A381N103_9ZZZZ